MTILTIKVFTGKKAPQEFRVSQSMRVQEVKQLCCDFFGFQDVANSYLWKDGVELKDDSCTLSEYGVLVNDVLELKRKRSRGTSQASLNRVQHRVAYQSSENKHQRLEFLSKLRAVWATAPPVEFEIEENVSPEQYVLPLTVEHHMILENAFDELDEELKE